ncbi:hypothetical protein [Ruania rhizosphaerae]|uniref:hypothetical protein n=1 Tax=Ruania rhizosphaerae TaxID=1840413 RepID=UPI0013588074|nr:hypothetical protein [Ruania rhizosphaerae]
MELTDILGYVVAAALVLVVVVGALLGVRQWRQRSAALTQWAQRHGWAFEPKVPQLTQRWKEHPIRGAGSATHVLRGTVAEGAITSFTSHVTIAGSSSTTTRHITVLEAPAVLPTVVAASPSAPVPNPHPPHDVDLADPHFTWTVVTTTPEAAGEVRRLLSSDVRDRLMQEAVSLHTVYLTFEGRDIILTTAGSLDVDRLEHRVSLIRDLARMMRVG